MEVVSKRQASYRQTSRGVERAMSSASSNSSPGLYSLSQPAFPDDFAGTHYQARTLPRPRRNHAVVTQTSSAVVAHVPANSRRRRMLSSQVSDYLKSLNSLTRSIQLEKEYVEERHAGEWPAMDETLQEEVVDEYFMPADVLAHYGTLPRTRRTSNSSLGSVLESQSCSGEPARLHRPLQSNLSQQVSGSYPAQDLASSPPTYFIPPTHNRLHKNQLSYRSKSLRKVMNIPPHTTDPVQKRDSGIGSDGESPRTSDEDALHNPLGFQRNHLRSFSQRQRKGSSRQTSLARSSTRRAHRTNGGEEFRGSASSGVGGSGGSTHRTSPFSSRRPRKQYENRYDPEVDMPDEELLHDHISTHTPDVVGSRTPSKPSRYSSRPKRPNRLQPRILVEKFQGEDDEKENGVVVIQNSISRVASNSSTGSTTDNSFDPSFPVFHNRPAVILTNLRRAQSEDSIDTDIESVALSNVSNLSKSTGILTEDESLLSVPTATARSVTPSAGKGGIVRSRPQSLRGGSSYQTSTSKFANRRAQFMPNMLRNQLSAQNSPAHSRQPTPSFSRQNTPSLSSPPPSDSHHRDQFSFKSPSHSSSSSSTAVSRHRRPSTSESVDINYSDYLSSPPHTPLTKSVTVSGVPHHLRVCRESQAQQRESGYISSSSESFPFSAQK